MTRSSYDESRCKAAIEHMARAIVRPRAMRYYGSNALSISAKRDRSVVTQADVEIEREIRAFLSDEFAHFGVVGEELGASHTDREHVWTIDPIDGTEAFVAGLPLFGTLLAVIHQTEEGARIPLLGAIYLPVQDRLIVGNGRQTTLDGRETKMSAPAASEQAKLILGDIAKIAQTMPMQAQTGLFRMAQRFRSAHTWGDCLGYLNMLTGKAHARAETNLGIDDIAPLEPIFLGAGGRVSTWDGKSFSKRLSELRDLEDASVSFTSVCAVTPALHEELVESLKHSARARHDRHPGERLSVYARGSLRTRRSR